MNIPLNEVDRILNIVDVLLGNVLFEGHEGQVLRIVLKVLKVMDVEKGYFDGINFAEDKSKGGFLVGTPSIYGLLSGKNSPVLHFSMVFLK